MELMARKEDLNQQMADLQRELDVVDAQLSVIQRVGTLLFISRDATRQPIDCLIMPIRKFTHHSIKYAGNRDLVAYLSNGVLKILDRSDPQWCSMVAELKPGFDPIDIAGFTLGYWTRRADTDDDQYQAKAWKDNLLG